MVVQVFSIQNKRGTQHLRRKSYGKDKTISHYSEQCPYKILKVLLALTFCISEGE